MIQGEADVIVIEIKHTINIMCLNHPETTPTPTCGKTVFHENSPWCQKKVGDHWFNPRKFMNTELDTKVLWITRSLSP